MKRNFVRNKKTDMRKQATKDSSSKRENLDNVRDSKLAKLFDRKDSNDIRWYTKNKGLFEAATRITWATISGLTRPLPSTEAAEIPGNVCAIYYAPNFIPDESIVAQAWISQYSNVVHANSRNQSYDYTDLAILSYAGMQVFSAIAHGIRTYGIMRRYREDSLLSPRKFVEASLFDFDDLKGQYALMWQDIEQLIVQSRQIWLPNVMPVIERWIWMNMNIYADSENAHSDYYMYVPGAFYKYDPKFNDKGGGLVKMREWHALPEGNNTWGMFPILNPRMKWKDYVTMVQSMIDALLPDQDRGIIYGDILKCYGMDKIFAMNSIDINYTTNVTYNPEVLWQIENLTCSGSFPVTLEQTADVSLTQNWSVSLTSNGGTDNFPLVSALENFVMNFHVMGQPTSEMIAVATRMMAGMPVDTPLYIYDGTTKKYVQDSHPNYKCYKPSCSGTEIPIAMKIYSNNVNANDKVVGQITDAWTVMPIQMSATATVSRMFGVLRKLTQLDWAPLLYSTSTSPTLTQPFTLPINGIYGELDNWAPVDGQTVKRVHMALLNSLYDVPAI